MRAAAAAAVGGPRRRRERRSATAARARVRKGKEKIGGSNPNTKSCVPVRTMVENLMEKLNVRLNKIEQKLDKGEREHENKRKGNIDK